jgi:hypothetical protein
VQNTPRQIVSTQETLASDTMQQLRHLYNSSVSVQGVDLGRSVDGIAGSNPARGMDFFCIGFLYVALSCVGTGLCEELITRPKESYQVSNTIRQV